jgi:gliding motility-associated protein GldM
MGHGKETPRQKMIGMMYLVLTAMLALNVSKDILEAFVLVDEGLTTTTENFAEKNSILYNEFDKAYISNPKKVGPFKDKAQEIKKQADELFGYIQDLKVEIVKKVEGPESPAVEGKKIHGKLISAKDNMDKPAEIMVGSTGNGKGKELKAKIIKFKEYLISLAGGQKEIIESIEKTLDTDNPPPKEGVIHTWESEHFEHLPMIAVTTLMSKMQGDIRNAETEMLRYLFNNIEAGSFKFNKLDATVIPNSNYILRGGEYRAEVFMAAFDTTQSPSILIGQTKAVTGSDGKVDYEMVGKFDSLPIDPKTRKGIFSRVGATLGSNKWSGLIKLKATDGTWIKKPFSAEYTVAEPNVVISPTKMNVFYTGVDNPVDISVPGVPADKITATCSNGLIQRSGKAWVVKPRSVGKAMVQVVCEIDGKKKPMGQMEFRVKDIPDPMAMVSFKKTGKVDKNTLLQSAIVDAVLEGFDFDAKFTVTEFTLSATIRGFEQAESVKSNRINDRMREIIKGANKGDKVFISPIMAVGPDGKQRELNALVFTLK